MGQYCLIVRLDVDDLIEYKAGRVSLCSIVDVVVQEQPKMN